MISKVEVIAVRRTIRRMDLRITAKERTIKTNVKVNWMHLKVIKEIQINIVVMMEIWKVRKVIRWKIKRMMPQNQIKKGRTIKRIPKLKLLLKQPLYYNSKQSQFQHLPTVSKVKVVSDLTV